MRIATIIDDVVICSTGGKGSTLLKLREQYSFVPSFFIICPDGDDDIDKNSVAILEAFDRLGVQYVAVRSSANVEDQVEATFAGLFETRLNVSRDSLLDAVRFVHSSRCSPRLDAYCCDRGIDAHSITMSIIVQCQVESEISGVCFSRYAHNSDLGLVEAVWGLGEAIVQGWETPDRYVFDREYPPNLLEVRVGNQMHMIRRRCEVDYRSIEEDCAYANTVKELVAGHKRLRRKLTDKQVQQVAELALMIESEHGYEVADIEFAFSAGQLYLLQARPGAHPTVITGREPVNSLRISK